MTDMLPCPFCGAIPVFVNRGNAKRAVPKMDPTEFVWDVECKTPGCYAEFGGENWETQEAVAEMWNRRTLPLTGPFLPVADMSQIEAGSITIGDKNGLHMIIDDQGQRIYDGDRLVHNA